jgi:hypothetical protein
MTNALSTIAKMVCLFSLEISYETLMWYGPISVKFGPRFENTFELSHLCIYMVMQYVMH